MKGKATSATNRFLIAATGFLVTLCLGTLYAWSIFVPSLEAEFGWTRAMVTLPFTVAGMVFAFGMAPAGRLQDLKGPGPLLVASAVLVAAGYVASAQAQNLATLVISFGVIVGLAMASGYMAIVGGTQVVSRHEGNGDRHPGRRLWGCRCRARAPRTLSQCRVWLAQCLYGPWPSVWAGSRCFRSHHQKPATRMASGRVGP